MNNKILNFQMLHGGDYNPDQWLDRPDILKKDIELMKASHVNCVSVGIFAWVRLEPEEGLYTFDWLGDVIESLYENGIYTILATPSGARPAWMAQKYPEVLRVAPDRTRNLMGTRHNHCYTSPVYRTKAFEMNKRLAEAFGDHPGVILWHLSNEYGGTCHCPLCQEEFRKWLKAKYKTLDALNHAWWTAFWSHTYTDWSQVESPSPRGETMVHGLSLDWMRFTTDRTIDFMKHEIEGVRAGGSKLPVTTNLMGFYDGLNYFKFKDLLDISSWDSYPTWHVEPDIIETAIRTACAHDLMRSIKKEPFLLMESTPSQVNWQPINRLKRPGVHMLSSMQAVAHGSNSVQYFQWRKSRGSSEKFHGAVVDHFGEADTRTFRDVTAVGERLEKLETLCQTNLKPKVAILYDWENRWAMEQSQAARNRNMHYVETIQSHYQAFWRLGVPVDIIDMECDISGYDLVVAPMLYMYRAGIEDKMRAFVEQGGTLVGTYWSGQVDESDLCFLGGVPGKMMDVFGLRAEEIDALPDGHSNFTVYRGMEYRLTELCERVIPTSAEVLAIYGEDFYAGDPVLTVNSFGKGKAFYLAAKAEDDFFQKFYRRLWKEGVFARPFGEELPEGVAVSLRENDDHKIFVLQNYNKEPVTLSLKTPVADFETGEQVSELTLEGYEVRFVER